jgi:hypothetical protein
VNPTGFESEQVAVIDHYAMHGDQYERRTTAYLGRFQAFLTGTVAMDFTVTADQRYEFIARTVRRFGYARLKRANKAVVLRFLERVSSYSRQQLTRLVKRGCERRKLVKRHQGSRTSFARIYTSADVLLSPTPTPCTARYPAWQPRSSWSGLAPSSAMPAINAWRRSRWLICTTCVSVPATSTSVRSGPRRAP